LRLDAPFGKAPPPRHRACGRVVGGGLKFLDLGWTNDHAAFCLDCPLPRFGSAARAHRGGRAFRPTRL